ncbi:MAG: bifunctional phosphoserine phosphatase/homoserine phosphotransferase ThrH [Gammaproteobacteria bacterium]|nr:bifunctional phosphoserine phosphatase/homoserine phosphotransferase ThrH [Gammaproteobacteria bacterium]
MDVLCLDLEGVLIPEIWQAVAAETGIDALRKTTRDIPVYDDLMQLRLGVLAEHDLSMGLIESVIDSVDPLPGANDFLDWARQRYQVVIISDTFYQFAAPLMDKLGRPTLLCHQLVVENDRITGYRIRQPDPKRCSVRAFKSLEYRVLAAGDSYNDVSMLEEADAGFFFMAPDNVRAEYPQYPFAASYAELQDLLSASAA